MSELNARPYYPAIMCHSGHRNFQFYQQINDHMTIKEVKKIVTFVTFIIQIIKILIIENIRKFKI